MTDLTTGVTIEAGEGNQLLGRVINVVWNDHHVTMTLCADRNASPKEICIRNFANALSLCPRGSAMAYWTQSDELVSE
jgi:hypothetical protein